MSLPTTHPHEWTRDGFLISTDPRLIDLQAVNAAFASSQLPWAKALSTEELKVMHEQSVWFGLYSPTSHSSTPSEDSVEPKAAMIGLARLCTDRVSMAYLTDVYVLPEWQRQGLGSWLIKCVKEWWDMMPSGRRLMLIAHEGKEAYYAKLLSSGRMESESSGYRVLTAKGRGASV